MYVAYLKNGNQLNEAKMRILCSLIFINENSIIIIILQKSDQIRCKSSIISIKPKQFTIIILF